MKKRGCHVIAALLAVPFSVLSLCSLPAWGHDTVDRGQHDATGPYPVVQKSFGIGGDPKHLTRTILMDMEDSMRFSPAEITVKVGDTIRFVLHNQGNMLHEWVLGTGTDLKEHAELMKKFPNMEHNEVHMVHVAPGKTQQIVWRFNRAGTFSFACLMPGHYEAGMLGMVTVKP